MEDPLKVYDDVLKIAVENNTTSDQRKTIYNMTSKLFDSYTFTRNKNDVNYADDNLNKLENGLLTFDQANEFIIWLQSKQTYSSFNEEW